MTVKSDAGFAGLKPTKQKLKQDPPPLPRPKKVQKNNNPFK